jgi:hypothetical protein
MIATTTAAEMETATIAPPYLNRLPREPVPGPGNMASGNSGRSKPPLREARVQFDGVRERLC